MKRTGANKDVDRRRYQAEDNEGHLPGSNLANFNEHQPAKRRTMIEASSITWMTGRKQEEDRRKAKGKR